MKYLPIVILSAAIWAASFSTRQVNADEKQQWPAAFQLYPFPAQGSAFPYAWKINTYTGKTEICTGKLDNLGFKCFAVEDAQ